MRKNIIRPITRSIFGSMVILLAIAMIVLQACSTSDDPTIGAPTVDSFTLYTDQGTPNAGPVGSLVKLTGTYFSAAGTNTVKFNGVDAEVIKSKTTVTNLTVIVPEGATTGKVTVTVGGHTGTSKTDFTVNSGTPAPGIVDFTPTSGNGVDTIKVTINGVNFSTTAANNVVKFNGVDAGIPKEASARSLTVVVPKGAAKGKITVKVAGVNGTAESGTDFAVPAPSIAKFTPKMSIVGSTVEITGTNFSKNAEFNVVKFNGVEAVVQEVNVKDAAANVLTVTIPAGATTGKITVDVDGSVGTSPGDDFEVN